MVDLFPGYNFNLRGSAFRSDSVTPLGPNSVLIEFRGYGLLKDTGLWACLEIADLNADGHQDLVIGNIGENSFYKKGHESKLAAVLCHELFLHLLAQLHNGSHIHFVEGR